MTTQYTQGYNEARIKLAAYRQAKPLPPKPPTMGERVKDHLVNVALVNGLALAGLGYWVVGGHREH